MSYKDNMKIQEECGIFGIYDVEGNCARSVYYGLYALQHRGQEACGIATINNLELSCYKDVGLVGDIFSETKLDDLAGTIAIGHVRYCAKEDSCRENAQPLTFKYSKGSLAVAYNGKLIRSQELRKEYESECSVFHTTTDSEIFVHAISQARIQSSSIEEAVSQVVKQLKGSFSLVVMSSRKLIAARDPWGIRPLCIGQRGNSIVFASESCALDSIGATFIRDVEPGEVLCVFESKLTSNRNNCMNKSSLCIFEYLYLARPDSVIDGQSVYNARILTGQQLAREHPIDGDVVIGVPDSGLIAAQAYALEIGIKYSLGFVMNRYIGRTFIKPDQTTREEAVKIKLNPLKATVKGKRIIMVEDSIVRGTTILPTVKMLREAGAIEVHVISATPKLINPCYFGTDFPSKNELFACKYSTEEMCHSIGADSLEFLSLDGLKTITPDSKCNFCKACFTGDYPAI